MYVLRFTTLIGTLRTAWLIQSVGSNGRHAGGFHIRLKVNCTWFRYMEQIQRLCGLFGLDSWQIFSTDETKKPSFPVMFRGWSIGYPHRITFCGWKEPIYSRKSNKPFVVCVPCADNLVSSPLLDERLNFSEFIHVCLLRLHQQRCSTRISLIR